MDNIKTITAYTETNGDLTVELYDRKYHNNDFNDYAVTCIDEISITGDHSEMGQDQIKMIAQLHLNCDGVDWDESDLNCELLGG